MFVEHLLVGVAEAPQSLPADCNQLVPLVVRQAVDEGFAGTRWRTLTW